MESFSPQGRREPFPFSVHLREGASRLREGASPQLRQGAMAALRLRLRLGAPFSTMLSSLSTLLQGE